MNNARLNPVHPVRVAVAAAALAAAAGIAAGQAQAAPQHKAAATRGPAVEASFKHPKLRHGLLTVTGTDANDMIALRLQAGDPDVLQVDVGADGSADFSFERDRIAEI